MIVNKKIQELVTKYRENKLSHAFLFVTNDIIKCNHDVKNFIKQISCENKYKDDCSQCNICYQIDHNAIPNIQEIFPDGNIIRKQQILDLKEKFKTKPLYISNNIYIINNAEKLNASSANTMLKFLEEPEDNIIGFFITNNKEIMLDTIKSRCQIIVVNYDIDTMSQLLGISEEELNKYENIAKEYLQKIIVDKEGLIVNKTVVLNNFSERSQINILFQYLYYLLNNIINGNVTDKQYDFLINKDLKDLLKYQKLVYQTLESSYFNVNIELLLDNFVLEMEAIK